MGLILQGILNMPYPDDPSEMDVVTWFQARKAMRHSWSEIEEQRDRIQALEDENKRLREALHSVAYWSRFEGHLPWCRDIIRAALAQTSTKEGEE